MSRHHQRLLIFCVLMVAANVLVVRMPFGAPTVLEHALETIPSRLGLWRQSSRDLDRDSLPSGETDSVFRKYVHSDGLTIYLYVGFWGKFEPGAKTLSRKHLLPRKNWDTKETRRVAVESGEPSFPVHISISAKDGFSCVTAYQYRLAGEPITVSYAERFRYSLGALGSRDSSVTLLKVFSEPIDPQDVERVSLLVLGFTEQALLELDRIDPSGKPNES